MITDLSQMVVLVARENNGTMQLLGTSFIVGKNGLFATARHVVGDNTNNLYILLPHINNIDDYQDTSNNRCNFVKASVSEINPVTDLCILKTNLNYPQDAILRISGLDEVLVGDEVDIYGFPHCVMGRRVLTYQKAEVGAKMLLECDGVLSKYATLNIQTRPGQSGSLIYNRTKNSIIGLLIGSYAPNSGVIIAGINPHELNQTSYCISANYINEML